MQMIQTKPKRAVRSPLPLGAPVARRKSIAGQSVFIALAVLFLLAFLGAVFITVIARNLAQAGRTTQTLNADYYAQAGINYANQMLETSPQGADWRPPLQALLSKAMVQQMSQQQYTAYFQAVGAPAGTTQATYNPAGGGTYTLPGVATGGSEAADPDAVWLAEGFTRYNVGNGRFLIRLSYVFNPDTGFPSQNGQAPTGTEKYIRIDSIGRFGNVDPTDPTTYVNQPPTRLRAEMTAYKPIGLTDFARFITNRDDRSDTSNLGIPSVNTAVAGNPYLTSEQNGSLPGYFTPVPSTGYSTQIFGNNAATPTALQGFSTTLVTPAVVDFDANNLPDIRPYPIITTYGQPSGYSNYGTGGNANNLTFGGGSLMVNGDLRLYGLNIAYLNPSIGDSWQIAGNLLFDRYNVPSGTSATLAAHAANLANQQAQLEVYSEPPGTTTPGLYEAPGTTTPGLFPSNDPFFATDGGLVRDGNTGSDIQGYPRSVQRLDPPSLDIADPSSGLTRYKALTYPTTASPAINTGSPATVYINNDADIQTQSANASGESTLRDEWLNRNGTTSPAANWKADFYNPPGVVIRFGPIPNPTPPSSQSNPQPYLMLSNGEPAWGITITRSDSTLDTNSPIYWPERNTTTSTNPAGQSYPYSSANNTGTSQTIYLVYAPLASQVPAGENPAPPTVVGNDPGYPYFFVNAENAQNATANAGTTIPDPNNDITIYADGNVRVSGIVSDPATGNNNVAYQHVTIVTGGVGYIDGSILKGGPGYGAITNGVLSDTSQSSAAILAESYVCVNTTQFFAGPPDFNQSTASGLTESTSNPFTVDFSESSQVLTEPVDLFPVIDATTGNTITSSSTSPNTPLSLYISQFMPASVAPLPNYSNVQGQVTITDNTSPIATVPGLLPAGSSTGYGSSAGPGAPVWSTQTTAPINLNDLENYLLGFSMTNASQGWELEHAGVFPANARIEAILYAEKGSFFVIPGPWFNSNTSDNIESYAANTDAQRNDAGTGADTDPNFQRFPFSGQPVDLQISVFGTVAENLPADLGDQSAWETKWGWVPIFHGNLYKNFTISGTSVGPEVTPLRDPTYNVKIPQVGLNFSYDPADGFDFVNQNNALQYVRLDEYGRPLPVAPDLPVSTDLLYSGQPQTTSLLP